MKPEAAKILEHYAAQQSPDPARVAASLDALQARVDAGELGPEPGAAPPVEASGLAAGPVVAGVVALCLGVGALWWWGAKVTDVDTIASVDAPADDAPHAEAPQAMAAAEPIPRAASTSARSAVDPPDVSRPPSIPEHATRSRGAEAPPRSHARRDATVASPPSASQTQPRREGDTAKQASGGATPEPLPSLGPEMELMRAARTAIGAGQGRRALELLAEHATRFPRGSFAKEREVSRVTAHCALGEHQRAVEVAQRFLKTHPNGVLADRVRNSCAGSGLAQP